MSNPASFKGFETWLTSIKMNSKMLFFNAIFVLSLQVIATTFFANLLIGSWKFAALFKFALAKFLRSFPDSTPLFNSIPLFNPNFEINIPGHKPLMISAVNLASVPANTMFTHGDLVRSFLAIGAGCCVWFLFPKLISFFKTRAVKENGIEFVRGMKLLEEKELIDEIKSSPDCQGVIPIGGVVLPFKYEPEHIFLAGKTRVGKTVCMTQMVDSLIKNNRRMVIVDLKGEYIKSFYRPGKDIILNPLDTRGANWEILNEIRSTVDFPALSESLIPSDTGSKDPFWAKASQDVFKGIMAYAVANDRLKNSDLWEISRKPLPQLAEAIATTPQGFAGAAQIQKSDGNKADSVYSVMMSYVGFLEFTGETGGEKFTIADWLADPEAGNIYISSKNELEAVLRPYISLFIDLLVKRVCDLPETRDMQLTLILDELGNLQKLPSLKKFTTLAGGRGANVIMSTQDYSAIEKVYGREDARSVLNSCGTTLTLCLSDDETSEKFSRKFGEYQFYETIENKTMGPADSRDGITLNRQKKTEKRILASEIMSLKKLEGYLKIPEFDPAKVKLQITQANRLPQKNEDFILRPGLELTKIQEKAAEIRETVQEFGLSAAPAVAGNEKEEEEELDDF